VVLRYSTGATLRQRRAYIDAEWKDELSHVLQSPSNGTSEQLECYFRRRALHFSTSLCGYIWRRIITRLTSTYDSDHFHHIRSREQDFHSFERLECASHTPTHKWVRYLGLGTSWNNFPAFFTSHSPPHSSYPYTLHGEW